MTRVYLADAHPEERSALRLVLLDLDMDVVGEAADWRTTLAQAPVTNLDMLLVDWDLLPVGGGAVPGQIAPGLSECDRGCPDQSSGFPPSGCRLCRSRCIHQ
jgi:DNA-binding NarL/FixJ family response regulator